MNTPLINIIGIGATGSKACLALLRRGLQVRAYDFDSVSQNNLLNQIYRVEDIGKPKVTAMQNIAISIGKSDNYEGFNIKITPENIRRYITGGIVLVLTDTIQSRLEIFNALQLSHINKIIETRVGVSEIYVYSVAMSSSVAKDKYALTFSVTPEEARTLCGSRVEVNATSDIASAMVQTLLLDNIEFTGEIYINRLSPVYFINKYE